MRPGPRGKRGWAFSGEPKRAAERTCRRRVGWLPRSYARKRSRSSTKISRRVAPFRRVRTERASVLRAVLDEEVRHTTRRTSPPSGWRATRTSRAPLPRRRRCRPLRRLRRRMPGLFGSLWPHTRDCPQQENPSLGAPSGAESLAELVNPLAPIRAGLRVPGSGHPLVATAGAPLRRRPEPRAR